jgi:hypothetical protein
MRSSLDDATRDEHEHEVHSRSRIGDRSAGRSDARRDAGLATSYSGDYDYTHTAAGSLQRFLTGYIYIHIRLRYLRLERY